MHRDLAASLPPLAKLSLNVIKAFHSAHPRARSQVAVSSDTEARNRSRALPENNVHAIVRSHEGSPTDKFPKSMTAQSFPSLTSRFPALTSPCTQTGELFHREFRAFSQTAVAALISIFPSRIFNACRVSPS